MQGQCRLLNDTSNAKWGVNTGFSRGGVHIVMCIPMRLTSCQTALTKPNTERSLQSYIEMAEFEQNFAFIGAIYLSHTMDRIILTLT